jgi:hypothetical protein
VKCRESREGRIVKRNVVCGDDGLDRFAPLTPILHLLYFAYFTVLYLVLYLFQCLIEFNFFDNLL